MRFNQYINEAFRSNAISPQEAAKTMGIRCQDILRCYNNGPERIYRGIEISRDTNYVFVEPSKFTRKSANTSNYYTLLMDNLECWEDYPKRSKSIICSTAYGSAKTYGRGEPFLVVPYNSYNIGVCNDSDIWNSFPMAIKSTNNWDMSTFNTSLADVLFDVSWALTTHSPDGRTDASWEKLKSHLEQANNFLQKNGKDSFTAQCKIFLQHFNPKKETLIEFLGRIMDPKKNKFKLISVGDKLPKDRKEVWTDAPSFLIRHDHFNDILRLM